MEERINYLFRKYLENTCTKEEFDELFSLMQDGSNEVLLGNYIGKAYERESEKQLPRFRKRRPTLAIAAAILILLSAGTFWFTANTVFRAPNTQADNTVKREAKLMKTTERSEYKYLLLPDSTQVWLNAESSLEFPERFSGAKREVTLKGEAYFDVKHADRIPFIIYTGNVSTEVLGTAFNIKAYPDMEKITVSVNRGKVRVNYANKAVAMLTRGQQVSIGQQVKSIREKEIPNKEVQGWQEGNLEYDDYRIGDIVLDLARIYDVKINIRSQDVGNLRVSTSFRRQQGVEAALEVICRLTETRLMVNGGAYDITDK